MSVDENKAVVLSFLRDVWEAGNLAKVDELVADDHVHHLTKGDARGPEGVKRLVSWAHGFLPDARLTIRELIGEGDKVVAYFVISGTDQGGYKGHPPSGQSVAYAGIDIFRVARGKIVERWGLVDTISMMHQIGAIPQKEPSEPQA